MIYFDGKETSEYALTLYGDVSGDGVVNAIDLLMVRKYILSLHPLEEEYLQSADINRDGAVNAVDLLMVRKNILGLYEIEQ